MAIQFNCSSCNAVLRVGDESAGKSARCPTCQSIQPIPGPSAPTPSDDPFGAFKSEFNEPQAPSANPYASPVTSHASSNVSAGGYHPTVVDFGEVFSHAWKAYLPNLGTLLGAVVIAFAVSAAFVIPSSVLNALAERTGRMELMLLSVLLSMVGNVLSIFIGIGMARLCIAAARFQPTNVGMLFSGGDVFLPVLGASILLGIAVVFGLMLLILPGLILVILLWPYYYFIVDRQCGAIESFSRAFEVGKLNWLTSILIMIVSTALSIAGMLALGIGFLFAAPFIAVMGATTYLMMKGERLGQPGIPQSGAPHAAF